MTQNYYESFYFNRPDVLILHHREKYERTASGKSWKSKPYDTKNDFFDSVQYTNFITSIPFFNRFGDGAYCRAYHSYTRFGYLPYEIVTVSPYKTQKNIDQFQIILKSDLYDSAGYREKYILDHAKSWENLNSCNGHEIIVFYTLENGDCCSGEFDLTARKWVG